MDFSTVEAIKQAGFIGFKSFTDLHKTKCSDVSSEAGVYMVLREVQTLPTFLVTSPVGTKTTRKKTPYLVDDLQTRWLDKTTVLYIGKAGGTGKDATLKKRLWQYVNTGLGQVNHSGGRAIWQLEDAWDLIVCWQVVTDVEPRVKEAQLIQEFYNVYKQRPFANRVG